jgi:hypothetical protein
MSRAARADAQIHVFQVSCLPEIDLFEIRSIGSFYEPRALVAGTSHDLTGKGYALYSPVWAFYQLDKPSGERDDPLVASPTGFECKLRTDTVELFVVPIPSKSYSAGPVDILVSLSIAGHWVVDNVPFRLCEDRGPITRLAYEGDLKSLSLEGRFGGTWPDKVDSNDAWDNRQRRYLYDSASLEQWDSVIRGQKALPIPLTAKDIDYYQDTSSESYGRSIDEC